MNENEILCPLCGYQYDQKDGVDACGSCPLSTGCEQVCCPHCGYRVFTRSRIIDAFRRLFGLEREGGVMAHPMTPELALEELAEEIGTLAERDEHREEVILSGSKVPNPAPILEEMQQRGLVQRRAGQVELTLPGEAIFRAVIRRHRLAEVLLSQILQVSEPHASDTACQFEHMLSEDVTDSICTFLSHPPTCPHGKTIPRGDCCASFRREVSPLVRPVDDLPLGGEGCIVFIQHSQRLDRLATLGIMPGTRVRLVQRQPSVVLEAGETTVALDREITAGIYVRPAG